MTRKTKRGGKKETVFESLVKLRMEKEHLQNLETKVKEIGTDHFLRAIFFYESSFLILIFAILDMIFI